VIADVFSNIWNFLTGTASYIKEQISQIQNFLSGLSSMINSFINLFPSEIKITIITALGIILVILVVKLVWKGA
jgi:hypothetical protein